MEKGTSDAGSDPLQYTALFMSGLKSGIPWDELVGMQLPRLVMMVDSIRPRTSKRTRGGREVRDATQADIDAFF